MVGKLWFSKGRETFAEISTDFIPENKSLVNLFQRLWVWAKPTNTFRLRKQPWQKPRL